MDQEYFKTDQITLDSYNDSIISEFYSKGYVFTRIAKGILNQTRSLRINLQNFDLTSENRRVLGKGQSIELDIVKLPYPDYSWEIHKLGKDFYTTKFGDNVMSASKIKELFLETDKTSFNYCFKYSISNKPVGYCLAYVNESIVHYAYPFYDLTIPKEMNLGMNMMLKAINWSKDAKKEYVYLGSVTDAKSKYKLQFKGLEWFNTDSKEWSTNLEELNTLLNV